MSLTLKCGEVGGNDKSASHPGETTSKVQTERGAAVTDGGTERVEQSGAGLIRSYLAPQHFMVV